jgi:hypothetical protein
MLPHPGVLPGGGRVCPGVFSLKPVAAVFLQFSNLRRPFLTKRAFFVVAMTNNQADQQTLYCQPCGEEHGSPLDSSQIYHWQTGACHYCGDWTDITDGFEFDLINGHLISQTEKVSLLTIIKRWLLLFITLLTK